MNIDPERLCSVTQYQSSHSSALAFGLASIEDVEVYLSNCTVTVLPQSTHSITEAPSEHESTLLSAVLPLSTLKFKVLQMLSLIQSCNAPLPRITTRS